MVAALCALGVGELLAGVMESGPSPVVAVGELVIDAAPPPVERFGIETFGTNDKPALVIGTVLLAGAFGALLGRIGRLRPRIAAAGIVGFGALGVVAASRSEDSLVGALVPNIFAVAAGVAVLWSLLRAAPASLTGSTGTGPGAGRADRRRFLAFSGGAVAAAGLLAAGGRRLASRFRVDEIRTAIRLPAPTEPAPAISAEAGLDVAGVSPLYTPNENFYRIDTALVTPQVDPTGWSLGIEGMVDRPRAFTYDELLARELVELDVTLACVSNEVGGGLVGTARWLGVPLAELLDEAGVSPDATQLVGRSVDGFTAGFPVGHAFDGEALVAVGMNGEPLPIEHGFPARLVVPGLYGYVSATKWLEEIELTTFEAFDAYWIRRNWARFGPILTQSRIDTPRSGVQIPAGPLAIAGVAWAPTRGIRSVEVRIDDGDWQAAELSAPIDEDIWRQWVLRTRLDAGTHRITVRATDGTGEVQTAESSPPFPDGATGYHEVTVDVG